MPKLKLFIPALVWVALIYILLTMPGKDVPSGGIFDIPNFDKLVHAGLFGMLVLLATFPFFRSKYASAVLFLKITLLAILYGVAMEFVQKYFTVDRDFDIWDMVADAFGALVGFAWITMRYKRFLRKRAVV